MNTNKNRRRSIRLKGYDYSTPGAYFITICAHDKLCLFGEIINTGKTEPAITALNDEWLNTEKIRNEIRFDEFVIMPNHIHGIVWITVGAYGNTPDGNTPARTKQNGASSKTVFVSPSQTIGAMVRGFKSAATRRIREIRHNPAMLVWQRNYWEHVIRDDTDMAHIREYVQNNPAQWELDSLNCNGAHP